MENSQLLGCMQIFIAVVDSGSFSASARRLGISQPSVSRQVNALEEHLGVRLIQRTTRRLSLTEAGQIYYEKARQIHADVLDAGQAIAGFKEKPSGVLKIAVPHTWAETTIAPHLGEFLSQYPDIILDIECNDFFQDIIMDRLDLVIRIGTLIDSSYIAVPLTKVRLVLCASSEYLAQYGTPRTPADLQNHNCIIFEKYDQWLFNDARQIQQINITGTLRTNTVSMMLSALQQNIGISLLPDTLIKPLLQSGQLLDIMPTQNFSIKNLPIEQVFALYSNRKHLAAKVRVFIDFFKEKFAQ